MRNWWIKQRELRGLAWQGSKREASSWQVCYELLRVFEADVSSGYTSKRSNANEHS